MTTTQPDGTRYIFVVRPRCPVCESPDLKTLRSAKSLDGSVSRRTVCVGCGHRFFVIVE